MEGRRGLLAFARNQFVVWHMPPFRRFPILLVMLWLSALPAAAQGSATAPGNSARPLARPADLKPPAARLQTPEQRCTGDGALCITLDSYIPDVCRTIETVAAQNKLDPHFLTRLVWKESLFDPGAVSPAGALGIAQFMPGTALLRGLDDPFNPAKALSASAKYLAELSALYGNLGLAAAAYNAGEKRVASFIAGERQLPRETRDYVRAITGRSGLDWRDAPPKTVDLTLDAKLSFHDACVSRAAKRSLREFKTAAPLVAPPPVARWGVIVSANPKRAVAEEAFARQRRRVGSVLTGRSPTITRKSIPGTARRSYTAQVGYDTRAQAEAFCNKLRRAGGSCMVLKN